MNVRKCIFYLLLLPWITVLADTPNFQKNVRAGMGSLLQGYWEWDGAIMKQARDVLLSAEKSSGGDAYARYHVAYADYLLTLFYFQTDKEKAKNYLHESFAHLERVIGDTRGELRAEACALYASGLGFALGLGNKAVEAPVLGPRIEEYFALAFKEGKKNPRVNLLRGISLLYTPETWGGGLDKAASFFRNSLEFFAGEMPTSEAAPRWGHDEAHYYLAVVARMKGEMEQAKKHLQDSLQVNPRFGLSRKALAEWNEKPLPAAVEKANVSGQ